MCNIYALCDPYTSEIRYIGKTVQPLHRRLSRHLVAARSGVDTHVARWIRTLGETGPFIRELGFVPETLAGRLEIATIARFRDCGYRLTNLTSGGEGLTNPLPETRAKLKWSDERRARVSAAKIGTTLSAEAKAKISEKAKGRVVPPETRAKFVGKVASAETRAKMSAAGKGRKRPPRSPEWCANISASKSGRKLSEAAVAEMRSRTISPEHRAKISAAFKGKKRAPFSDEWRANMSAAKKGKMVISPEQRAKISASLTGRKRGPNAEKKAIGLGAPPTIPGA